MIDMNLLFTKDCYGLKQTEKFNLLLPILNKLNDWHRDQCQLYNQILKAYGIAKHHRFTNLRDLPYLSVQLFKYLNLKSVAETEVFKVMASSGTTGQKVSKIYLDQETARLQSRALVKILQSFMGSQRLPMLIVDSESIVKNRNTFSARAAGIRGLATFGRDHTYLLNENMEINVDSLLQFCQRYQGQPILIFGFTFMVWQYLYQKLKELNIAVDLSNAILIHSGGWKKLSDQAVDNATFKKSLYELIRIKKIHNFYGMVEQVGSIFMECEAGYLHAPLFADILIRDVVRGGLSQQGEAGIIEVISVLPLSYPGHVLLTEDLGILQGVDDCSCGRVGNYFSVIGRIPKAEIRGCSDTHAQGAQ